jgi:putative ATP-dependent endonuclease of the OLD family
MKSMSRSIVALRVGQIIPSRQWSTKIHDLESLMELKNEELLQIAGDYSIPISNKKVKATIVGEIGEWKKSQPLLPGWQHIEASLLERLPELKIFESVDALDPELEIHATLRNSFVGRMKTNDYSGQLSNFSSRIVGDMQADLDKFVPILLQYCPDISTIDIQPTFDFSSGFKTSRLMLKKSSGTQIDLTKEGEGRRRRVTLAIYEWREQLLSSQASGSPFEQTIVAFDEPDTHLDYMSQRKIFDIIKRISSHPNTSVMVCTHSLNLIDRIPLTSIVHFVLKADQTVVSIITTDDPELTDIFLFQISESMGLRNSVMLNERCFLVVEGLTEMSALPILFALKYGYPPQAAGVRILNGEGGVGARLFSKFLHNNKRSVIFMIDNDTKTSPKGRYFTEASLKKDGIDTESQVHFIGKEEFEDSFSDQTYLEAAKTYWPRHDGSPWTVADLQNLRGKPDFAQRVLGLIRENTRSQIGKPQIALHLAKSIKDSNNIPPEIALCLDQAYLLATDDD